MCIIAIRNSVRHIRRVAQSNGEHSATSPKSSWLTCLCEMSGGRWPRSVTHHMTEPRNSCRHAPPSRIQAASDPPRPPRSLPLMTREARISETYITQTDAARMIIIVRIDNMNKNNDAKSASFGFQNISMFDYCL